MGEVRRVAGAAALGSRRRRRGSGRVHRGAGSRRALEAARASRRTVERARRGSDGFRRRRHARRPVASADDSAWSYPRTARRGSPDVYPVRAWSPAQPSRREPAGVSRRRRHVSAVVGSLRRYSWRAAPVLPHPRRDRERRANASVVSPRLRSRCRCDIGRRRCRRASRLVVVTSSSTALGRRRQGRRDRRGLERSTTAVRCRLRRGDHRGAPDRRRGVTSSPRSETSRLTRAESARPDPPRRIDVRVGSSTNALQPISSAERRLGAGLAQWLALLVVAGTAVAADQLTKSIVAMRLPSRRRGRPMIGPFSIHHVQNSGIAFGLFAHSTTAVIVLTAVAVTAMLVFFARSAQRHPLLPDRARARDRRQRLEPDRPRPARLRDRLPRLRLLAGVQPRRHLHRRRRRAACSSRSWRPTGRARTLARLRFHVPEHHAGARLDRVLAARPELESRAPPSA